MRNSLFSASASTGLSELFLEICLSLSDIWVRSSLVLSQSPLAKNAATNAKVVDVVGFGVGDGLGTAWQQFFEVQPLFLSWFGLS